MLLKVSFVFFLILIAYLSITPTETISVGNDKISHFLAYTVLGLNATLIAYPARKKMIASTLLVIAIGAFLEVTQHFVPSRVMSIFDFYADLGGAILGLTLTLLLGKWLLQILNSTKLI